MDIINATIEHIPEIVDFNLREYEVAENKALDHFNELQWWGHNDLLKWHFANLERNGGGILLAVDKNSIIRGQLDYVRSIQEERLHIVWLLVDKGMRRQGIAKSLIAELQRKGKREGIGKIWTEAEDERTEELYRSLGRVKDHLENYWIDLNFDFEEDLNRYELVFHEGELVETLPRKTDLEVREFRGNSKNMKMFAEYERIIGDYLTPEFDLSQLTSSINTLAGQFVWGETTPLEIAEYRLSNGKVLAILTQYVRIFKKGEAKAEEIQEVITDVVHRLALKNYEAVDVQVLKSRGLGPILQKAGFAKVEEDPVFEIIIPPTDSS